MSKLDKSTAIDGLQECSSTLGKGGHSFNVVCTVCGGKADLKKDKNLYACKKSHWETSKYNVDAENEIASLLEKEKVAYRNEIRYRLEKGFPYHATVDYAIRRLEGEKGMKAYVEGLGLKRTSLPGRRSSSGSTPNVFYKLPNEPASNDLNRIMKEKLALSTFVTEMSREAGFHAQVLWREAFRKLGYDIVKEDANEFGGMKSTLEGNIDFIARKDGVVFGIEVKNELPYPTDLGAKFQIAVELGTIPVMVVRKVSPTAYDNLKKYGALVKIYETAIFNLEFKDTIEKCTKVLGYPLIALDEISEKTVGHTRDKVMAYGFGHVKELREANKKFLERVQYYRKSLIGLNKELRFQ